MLNISAKAVNVAAQEWYRQDAGDNYEEMSELLDETDIETQQAYHDGALKILVAALPHIRAQIIDEINIALFANETHYHPCRGLICAPFSSMKLFDKAPIANVRDVLNEKDGK